VDLSQRSGALARLIRHVAGVLYAGHILAE
jgi:hypothetical protein